MVYCWTVCLQKCCADDSHILYHVLARALDVGCPDDDLDDLGDREPEMGSALPGSSASDNSGEWHCHSAGYDSAVGGYYDCTCCCIAPETLRLVIYWEKEYR